MLRPLISCNTIHKRNTHADLGYRRGGLSVQTLSPPVAAFPRGNAHDDSKPQRGICQSGSLASTKRVIAYSCVNYLLWLLLIRGYFRFYRFVLYGVIRFGRLFYVRLIYGCYHF